MFGEAAEYNQLLLRYEDTSDSYEDGLGQTIMEHPEIAAISFTSDLISEIDNMLRSLNIVIVVLIVSAGLLAFVVLYNLNNINITERQRELATLKVLGFYDGEVASYVYGIRNPRRCGNRCVSAWKGDPNRRSGYDDVRKTYIFQKFLVQRTDHTGICIVSQWNDVLPAEKD